MNNSEFVSLTTKIFNMLARQIEDQDPAGEIDVIVSSDVLTIESHIGTFVINRHTVLQEIWLASPVSGPHHFAYREGRWLNKDGGEFFNILQNEMQKLQVKIINEEGL